MKKGACLVNTARGDLINEDDLLEALQNGQLGWAALDAFVQEPFEDQRFWGLSNLLMTPHTGAYTAEAVERTLITAAQEVLRLLAGKPPQYEIH
jgi:D-3-phosphoglycerate dehydrogenase